MLYRPSVLEGADPPQPLVVRVRRAAHRIFPLSCAIAGILAIWLIAAAVSNESVMPSPFLVVAEMRENWPSLWRETGFTVSGIVFGFLIAVAVAIPLAVASLYIPFFDRTIYPLLVSSQVVPKVALAPLFVVWFGYGLTTILVMACIIAFFPILVDALHGLRSVRPLNLSLFRSMRASRLQTLLRLQLPGAIPNIFVGLKLGMAFAVVGALVGEFVGSDRGLGYLIALSEGNLDTVGMMATIAWVTIIGLLLYFMIQGLERWVLGRPARLRAAAVRRATEAGSQAKENEVTAR